MALKQVMLAINWEGIWEKGFKLDFAGRQVLIVKWSEQVFFLSLYSTCMDYLLETKNYIN